jgi:hypothetical protein
MKEDNMPEVDIIDSWSKVNTWIVWYSSSTRNCHSPAFRADGPPWLIGSAPEASVQYERFPGLPRNFAPTPTLMPDRLKPSFVASHDIRYLQFWTVLVQFRIELETTAVLRYNSFKPENTRNGLRRFNLYGQSVQQCGWVLLDEDWIGDVVNNDVESQEFILLSEASLSTSVDLRHVEAEALSSREYNVMMIAWWDGVAERVGLERVIVHILELE